MLRHLALGPAVAAGIGIGALAARPLQAATYTVTNLQDGNNVAGSLRAAMRAANANPGADSINFDTDGGVLLLTDGAIPITDSVTIAGQLQPSVTLDANDQSQIFSINSNTTTAGLADVSMQNLWLQNGNSVAWGGAIVVDDANLQLSHVGISHSIAGTGGGLGIGPGGTGQVVLNQCTFSENGARGYGGGAALQTAAVEILDSAFVDNHAAYAAGMALQAYSTTITETLIAGNGSLSETAGLLIAGPGDAQMQLTDVTIRDNVSSAACGGLTINGGPVHLDASFVVGNSAVSAGGGVCIQGSDPVVLTNTTVAQNQATLGGGMVINQSTDVVLRFSTLADNQTTASGGGGGVFAFDGNTVTFDSSVVGQNTDGDGNPNDLVSSSGNAFWLRYSLVEDANGVPLDANNSLTGQASDLQPLQTSGVSGGTLMPSRTSPLLAAGNPVNPPATDARGLPRPTDTPPDIGAVQLQRCGSVLEGAACACTSECSQNCTCSAAAMCSGAAAANGTACTGGTCQQGLCIVADTNANGGGASSTTGGTGGSTTGGSTTGGTVPGGTTGNHSAPTLGTGSTTGSTSSTKSGCAAAPDTALWGTLMVGLRALWHRTRRSPTASRSSQCRKVQRSPSAVPPPGM